MYRINRFIIKLFPRSLTQPITGANFPFRSKASVRFYNYDNFHHKRINCGSSSFILCTSFLTWLGFSKEDENKESVLITTIKRSILLMQGNELSNAERMLHLALKIAQEQQNNDGVFYIYDLMANLALERGELNKSEKLFIIVLQHLLTEGLEQDHIKVIHISLKLARIYQMRNETEKAEIGYNWCLETIKKHLTTENVDANVLNAIIKDWYAKLLLETGRVQESIKYLNEALQICNEYEGENHEKSILLLNDLGTANMHAGKIDSAKECLINALKLAKKLEDFEYLGVLYANLGLICLREGLFVEAQRYCKLGLSIGRKQNNSDATEQAKYCIEQINAQK